MITTRQLDLRFEALKMLVLAILATILALLLVSQLHGATPQGLGAMPRVLPDDTAAYATPMGNEPLPQRQWNDDIPMPTVTPEMHGHLWQILQLHREKCPAEALLMWERVALPPHTRVYKPVAMAVAEMQLQNRDAAKVLLQRARDMDPKNGLVAYFMGILHLEQAAAAGREDPDVGAQFVAAMPWEANERRAMLELAAIMELRDAIRLADNVYPDEELMPDPQAANLGPLVGDLMLALRADKFVGKAHNALGDLLLRRGLLREAEEHMDAASEAGIPVLFGYEDLGLLYELQARPADVLRVYRKNFDQRGEPQIDWLVGWLIPGLKR